MTSIKSLLEQNQDVEKMDQETHDLVHKLFVKASFLMDGDQILGKAKAELLLAAADKIESLYKSRDAEVEKLKQALIVISEALEFYGDNSLGGGCWTFREKFFFDLTHEHDLDQLPEPVGERGQKYITGGKVARTALAKAREILKEGEP